MGAQRDNPNSSHYTFAKAVAGLRRDTQLHSGARRCSSRCEYGQNSLTSDSNTLLGKQYLDFA